MLRDTMIVVRGLSKMHNKFTAVDRVSFCVDEGEIYGLLGPNGAGKSTLIKMLACFWPPSAGEATIDGISVHEPGKVKQLIGWAPQEDSFYGKLTVEENLRYFGSLYRVPKERLNARIDELLDLIGLESKRGALAESLSGGMKKRLNIAIGLIHSPKVLFLDEPTVGVDPISRNQLWKVIDRIKQQKVTIVYTTHYMAEVERLCDRVAIIQGGRLVTIDTPANLKRKYGRTLEEAFVNLLARH
ncbi:ABC transporter ATP-binding protein [Candidatus Woesearchaeota archaeon]|nr:ABC transporter ATP-binding protein [Candidatus Woesearchaeota archaeon]